MSNESQALTVSTQSREVARTVDVTVGMSFADMVAMGDHLVRTNFLPEHIRTGQQFAAIVLDGRERGMLPMRAIRSLQMVKGKVIESADSQLARFKADGGRAKFLELDETRAVLWLRHPNGDEHTETWTLEDSKRAGLAGNMHGKFPKAMFRSRAITAGLKSLGWEGAVGTYDADELDVQPPTPPQRQQADASVDDIDEVNALGAAANALYAALGVPEDDRRAYSKRIIGDRKLSRLEAARAIVVSLRETVEAQEAAKAQEGGEQ